MLNFFSAACANSSDTISSASCVGYHLSLTFLDTHVPYMSLKARMPLWKLVWPVNLVFLSPTTKINPTMSKITGSIFKQLDSSMGPAPGLELQRILHPTLQCAIHCILDGTEWQYGLRYWRVLHSCQANLEELQFWVVLLCSSRPPGQWHMPITRWRDLTDTGSRGTTLHCAFLCLTRFLTFGSCLFGMCPVNLLCCDPVPI